MKVESIAYLEHYAILLTCIKRYLVLKTNFLSFLRMSLLHRFYVMEKQASEKNQSVNFTDKSILENVDINTKHICIIQWRSQKAENCTHIKGRLLYEQ